MKNTSEMIKMNYRDIKSFASAAFRQLCQNDYSYYNYKIIIIIIIITIIIIFIIIVFIIIIIIIITN